MSNVTVRQSHSLSVAEARSRLSVFEETLGKFGVKLKWKGDRAEIDGTGVSGGVTVAAGHVSVDIKLGLLAKAAGVDAGKLQGSLEKRLAAALDPAGPRDA